MPIEEQQQREAQIVKELAQQEEFARQQEQCKWDMQKKVDMTMCLVENFRNVKPLCILGKEGRN